MDLAFDLRVAGLPDGELIVDAMRGEEVLNDIYLLELEVLVPANIPIEEQALYRDGWLSVRLGEHQRAFHGVVSSVEIRGFRQSREQQRLECMITLVPRAWLMSQRKTSRIFQDMSVDEVIRRVLASYFIPARWMLAHRYPKREYCTQFEETDLAFVKRLCAEEGILFFFQQPRDAPSWSSTVAGIAGGVSQVLQSAAGGVGDLASLLPGLIDQAREVMVFTDNEHGYPPLDSGGGPDWQSLASEIAGAVGSVAGAVGGQAGAAVGQAAGIASSAIASAAPAPVLHVRGDTGGLHSDDEHTVTRFTRRQSLRPQRFTYREYDPHRPHAELSTHVHAEGVEALSGLLQAGRSAIEDALHGNAPTAGLEDLAGAAVSQLDQVLDPKQHLEHYEHHGRYLFPNWEHERGEALRMARAQRRRVDVASAASVCPWVTPGSRFRLEDHELDRLNREYAVIRVTHEVSRHVDERPARYANRFECVPASVAYVPERPGPRHIQVCLTAIVQAADSTGIHTDKGAHVRVRFHWDRGQSEQHFNTCWVRVMQPWAGPGFGTLFLPRAGSEVVISFEGGDPDRPLVMGCVYNGANLPPQPLPTNKTKTGIRTSSTPGGEGANELWFEDAAGSEQIYLHAQRDFDSEVARDRTAHIFHDDRLQIDNDQRRSVNGDVHVDVGGERQTRITQSDDLRVEGDRTVTVRGVDSGSIEGDRQRTVSQNDTLVVSGSSSLRVGGASVARHGGHVTRVIGSPDAMGNDTTHVEGSVRTSATKQIVLSADEAVVLQCGESVLRLSPAAIEMSSKRIVLQGEGARLRLSGGKARLQADDLLSGVANQIALQGSGAAIALSSEAAIDGSRVLLNSPATAEDSVETEEPEMTNIELLDDQGNPIANQPYRIEMPDGSVRSGVLDENGRAEVDLEDGGTVYFPGVTDVSEG